MYFTHNEGKPVISEIFIKTVKAKIYKKKKTANESKSYLPYLNKLVDQYNSTYHSIGKKPINANYSALTEKIETNPKAPKFKLMIESKLLSNGYIEIWSREIVFIDFVLKNNPWTYKI